MPELRLVDVLAAVSVATDLGMGQEPEKAIRSCLLATGLARGLDLDEEDVRDVYLTTLLRHLGCTATVRMHARVNVFQGSPEDLDRSTELALANAVPQMREIDGSVGIFLLGDRQTGRSIAITLWESEEALKASEEAANRLRKESAEEANEQVVSVERYEVFHEDRWGG